MLPGYTAQCSLCVISELSERPTDWLCCPILQRQKVRLEGETQRWHLWQSWAWSQILSYHAGLFLEVSLAWMSMEGDPRYGQALIVCSITQSCLTLCDPMDCSPPGSSIHGILQARILEWVAISFSTGSHYLLSLVTMDEMASTHFLNEKRRFQVSPAFKGEVKSLEWNQNREEPTRGMQAKYAKLPQKNSKARLLLRLCTWKHPYQHHTSWLKFRHMI